jgi:hypothetical protein
MWAGQPGHANLISFEEVDGAWVAQIEQAFAGGPDVTFAQWYFNEEPGTELRHRDLYYWSGAEYQLGLALAMNVSLQSYMDTRSAANIFRVLQPAQKQKLGLKLLTHTLQTNPYNPEIWYRLAQQTPGGPDALTLSQLVMSHPFDLPPTDSESANAQSLNEYWQTLEEFVPRFAILEHPVPQAEPDLRGIYKFLQSTSGITADDLSAYIDACVETPPHEHTDAVRYDNQLANNGDKYGQLRMAQRNRDGDGVAKNESEAKRLFWQAAAQGDPVASACLQKIYAYIPSDVITVTASSFYGQDQIPIHLVDGAGMTGIFHDNNGSAATMWHTSTSPDPTPPAPGLAPSPAWVKFDFVTSRKFKSILIWNHNQANLTNRGFQNTKIYGSSDGLTWFPLTTPETIVLPRAPGSPSAIPFTVFNTTADSSIKSVIVAASASNGNYGSDCFGLSAVRFVVTNN